jgi:site-specific DNA-methyltransferase (adenine-specific)
MTAQKKTRAPRNRTIDLSAEEMEIYRKRLVFGENLNDFQNKIVCGDAFRILKKLPRHSFDLLFADPPYNLTKNFGENSFRQTSLDEYETWLESWLADCSKLLKKTASVYICGDWRSASAIQRVGMKFFTLRNRITWEREKGRGARRIGKILRKTSGFSPFPKSLFSTPTPSRSNAACSRLIRKTARRRIGKSPKTEIFA